MKNFLSILNNNLDIFFSIFQQILIAIILTLLKLYQITLSPILGHNCRFYPSCSNYAIEAYTSLGILTGTSLALKRLVKCHPFHPGGLDQLPKKKGHLIKLMDKDN